MGVADRALRSLRRLAGREGGEPPAGADTVEVTAVPGSAARAEAPGTSPSSELAARRERLAAEVTELHWDLGGLAYEMAIRDHFRPDVLMRRAAVLQERDAELAEIERLLRMERDGVAGACPHCGAPRSRLATFCWQCGAALMGQTPAGDGVAAGGIDALLAPGAEQQPQADGR